MSPLRKIRFLVQENGEFVWRTFEGRWLIGSGLPDSKICVGRLSADADKRDFTRWCVVHSAKGNFVVYRTAPGRDYGQLSVHSSLDGLRQELPADLFEGVEVELGLRVVSDYPEVPLDV